MPLYVSHQGGTRSTAVVLEASHILQWVELHMPALSAVYISGVESWQAGYLGHQTLDKGECSTPGSV